MSRSTGTRLSLDKYTVAMICPLEVEITAARAMLNEEYDRLDTPKDGTNTYSFGSLGEHNMVLASLPEGSQGTNSAAGVAIHMGRTFPAIKLRLLVGIGGGVPSNGNDIRLGDVVVGTPTGETGGVVEYDLGKETTEGFIRKGVCPPLIGALTAMKSNHRLKKRNRIGDFLSEMHRRHDCLTEYERPRPEKDVLFLPDYEHHQGQPTCANCDGEKAKPRPPRDCPRVFYGLIASGNRVMKNATERDRISGNLGGAICFEMEAAGLMNNFECIVIRGIADYSDSHKNDAWHPCAAAAAASLAKELLSNIPGKYLFVVAKE
ncbi:nucleoside phosphorylase domain-containing protein [Lasiosphaeris hirsuta]|uniref:Nucleoside phosphorylase domain-containing protein n=1 Tax=Lasiosphaeris hirsuta TaxID=260670 RepID=A0AA40BCV9_9PEZI|nr:nucleoside phosphorylase domain-containing protein [Lasiosphaeris hirsuta]